MLHIIAGTFKNRKLKSPKSSETRPTTGKMREALFNICQNYIENARFLDVFAGSGAMGIEALSRGASSSVFIDHSRESIRCIQENLQTLGLENKGQSLCGDALAMIKKLDERSEKFHIIYIDPPYSVEGLANALIQKVDESSILVPGGLLFIEEGCDTMIDKIKWHALHLKSERKMGRAQLLQFEKDTHHEK